jgi:hypothetical protein
MYEVECPYCGKDIEINHDDGYGYKEDEIHEQECEHCEKTFCYTTSISYYHEAFQAPCKNGEDHDLQDIHGFPKEFFVGKKRCSICNEEVLVDEKANKEAMNEYMEGLKKNATKIK